MIKFCNLYSGSSGNSTYIESSSTRLLVDAGVSCQKISKALDELGSSLNSIDGILISHEHSDHIKGLEVISKKFGVPIYATKKTWAAMQNLKVADELKRFFVPEEDFMIGDIKVLAFSIPHDATEPCGFSLFNETKKITIATDIGHLDEELIKKMYASDILLIESNYDRDTLLCGPYPYMLKKRIQSDVGHLSNEMTGKAVKELYENGVSNIILGHLSKENNFPELAYQTTLNELQTSSCNLPFSLSVAKRDEVDDMITL